YVKTTQWLIPKEQREQGIPMGKTHDVKGRLKQQLISELMNATVDIEKDPFYIALGINVHNRGVAALLILQNIPIEVITAFLSQPIMREYYRRMNEQPRVVAIENGDPVPARNIHARDILGQKNRKALERYIVELQNNPGVSEETFTFDYLIRRVKSQGYGGKEQIAL